ncbi:hypothetical protein DFJ74DRAFT_601278 [Hyaloraphidium curvatum]|nr:hypothetical protein DFJ74DRAFT_601278 [Hyaloraphidium curvatum]
MTSTLPPNLLKLFTPRPALPFVEPVDKDTAKLPKPKFLGLAAFVDRAKGHDPEYVRTETHKERHDRIAAENKEKADEAIKAALAEWDPSSDPNVKSDPYRTLFVGRLSYETTEKTLAQAFETYGAIRTVTVVKDKEGKSRGYGFVEFESERDLKNAFNDADGMKIDGRRCVVDVERGRTVKGWKPRRLGGGLGGTRVGKPEQNQKHSGRDHSGRDTLPPGMRDSVEERQAPGDSGRNSPPEPGAIIEKEPYGRDRDRRRSRSPERRRSRSRERRDDSRRRSRSRDRDRRDDYRRRSKSPRDRTRSDRDSR